MKQEIRQAIERGNLVLLLGAGASKGSLDRQGRPLLDGTELAQALADQATLQYEGESLPMVYAAATQKIGTQQTRALLEGLFARCKPSASLGVIASFPWPRIYTLNIDDAFEAALRDHSLQRSMVHSRNDQIRDLDVLYSDLDFIKLNGSVSRLDDGIIFSPQEYGRSSGNLPLWYSELGRDFFRFRFLFIGTKINEPLFFHTIELYRNSVGGNPPVSFVLTPSASAIERESLRAVNLEHIAGTVDDLARWLRKEFSQSLTPLEVAITRRPELRAIFAQAGQPAKDRSLRLLSCLTLVSRESLGKQPADGAVDGQIRNFYRGFKPSWIDIVQEVPAKLSATSRFGAKIQEDEKTKRLIVCYGPAGSGKTTLLMQTALSIASRQDNPVYFLKEAPANFRDLIELLEESNQGDYYLFADRLDIIADDLSEMFEGKRIRKGIFVVSERESIWKSRASIKVDKYCGTPFALNVIDQDDAVSILEKLQKYGPWTRLGKMTTNERVSELLQKSKRQLLIGMLEATLGRGFEEIIEREYSSLSNDQQRRFVVVVGLATVHRLGMSLAIAARALDKLGIKDNLAVLCNAVAGIVSQSQGKLTARHAVYFRHLIESVIEPKELAACIAAVGSAYAVYGSPVAKFVSKEEGQIFKSIFNHRFMHDVLRGDITLILGIYRQFETVFRNDGLYWLQYGLALRDADLQTEAYDTLRTAYEAYRSEHTEHALAQQLLILADRTQDQARRASYLMEAIQRLDSMDAILERGNMYPLVTLAEGHTQVVRKWDGDSPARELAREYADKIRARLVDLPQHDRLAKAWKRLATYATNGIWIEETE